MITRTAKVITGKAALDTAEEDGEHVLWVQSTGEAKLVLPYEVPEVDIPRTLYLRRVSEE